MEEERNGGKDWEKTSHKQPLFLRIFDSLLLVRRTIKYFYSMNGKENNNDQGNDDSKHQKRKVLYFWCSYERAEREREEKMKQKRSTETERKMAMATPSLVPDHYFALL